MSFKNIPLAEVIDFYNGKAPHVSDNGEYSLYGSNGIIGKSKEYNHQAAIILGRVGAYCGSVEICENKFWASDNTIIVKPKSGYDLKFLYYRLRNMPLRGYAGGAAQPLLTQTILKGIRTSLPKFEVQQKIASILSAYDDLIENNRRRIQLLEESARLLYKEWFVYLRFPGHEHVKVVDGVPEGWERKKIVDICETVGGGTPSTSVPDYWDGDITWVVPTDITKNDCLVLLDSERKITEKGLRESSARLVPPNTILMTSRASVGFFALIDREVCTNQGFISIIPHDESSRMYFLFNLMSRVNEIRNNAKGTTYPEISKSQFRSMDILIPASALMWEFEQTTRNLIDQIRCLKKQTLRLKKARDLLLPRLMNGVIEA